MPSLPYYLGEPATLGVPIDQIDGTPMDLAGLGLRLVVNLSGSDLTIPAYAGSGEIIPPGGSELIDHPSILFVDLNEMNFPLSPRLYPFVVQTNDGTGWATLAGPDLFIKAWRR